MADGVAVHRVGRARREDALVDDSLQLRVETEATVAHREVNPRQPLVELRAEEGDRVVRLGVELVEQFGDEVVDESARLAADGSRWRSWPATILALYK